MRPSLPLEERASGFWELAGNTQEPLPWQKCRGLIGLPWERRTATQSHASDFPPPGPFPQAFISPTYAASQQNKTHSDQRVKPCRKNRPTLKVWRESTDSERKSPTIPYLHHQGFWRKARKYWGISKPTQG
jgi:hypothetical protein